MQFQARQLGKALFIILIAFCAFATVIYAVSATEGANTQNDAPTRIEVNTETDEIIFIINGETKAIINQDGLKVLGDTHSQAFLYGSKYVARPVDEVAQ